MRHAPWTLAVTLALAGVAHAQSVNIAWRTDLPRNGLAEAQALGRCALIYFTDGSEGCLALERGAFSDPGVGVALREFVPIRADCRSPQAHAELQERLGVTRYPTVIFFGPAGNAVDRLTSTQVAAVRGQLLHVLRTHWRPDANERPAGDRSQARGSTAPPPPPRRDPALPGSLGEWVNKGGWLDRFLRGLVMGFLPLLIAGLRGRPALGLVLGLMGSGLACALGGLPGVFAVAGATVVLSTRPEVLGARVSLANLLVFAAGAGLVAWFALGLARPELLPSAVRPVGLPTFAQDFRAVYTEWDRRLRAGDANGALEVVDEFVLLGETAGYERDVAGMRKLALGRGARDPGPRDMRWLVERTLRRRYVEGTIWGDLVAPGAGTLLLVFGFLGARAHRRLKRARGGPEWEEPERGTPRNPLEGGAL